VKKKLKNQALLDRLNSGMAVIHTPPGALVQFKRPLGLITVLITKDKAPFRPNFFKGFDAKEKALMLYLGIAKISLCAIEENRLIGFLDSTNFAHQFYYGEKSVYLRIRSPDQYYDIFRKYFIKVNTKDNPGR